MNAAWPSEIWPANPMITCMPRVPIAAIRAKMPTPIQRSEPTTQGTRSMPATKRPTPTTLPRRRGGAPRPRGALAGVVVEAAGAVTVIGSDPLDATAAEQPVRTDDENGEHEH